MKKSMKTLYEDDMDPLQEEKIALTNFLVYLGDKTLLENAKQANDWKTMKKIANGDYSFKLAKDLIMTDFLEDEGVDTFNIESRDRNLMSVTKSLTTVRKLEKIV